MTIILIQIFHIAPGAQGPLFHSIEQAIELLEEMDECIVTKNAVTIIKRNLARAKEYWTLIKDTSQQNAEASTSLHMVDLNFAPQTVNMFPASTGVGGSAGERLLPFDGQPFDDGQLLFGTQWGNSLNLLATSWGAGGS